MCLCLRSIASRRDSSRTFLARGLKGMWPLSRWPRRLVRGLRSRAPGPKAASTFSRIADRSMPIDSEGVGVEGVLRLLPDEADDALAGPVVVEAVPAQHAGREGVRLGEQAEQEVLGADAVVVQPPGVLLGEDHRLAGVLVEPFEHGYLSRRSRPRPPAYFL